MENEKRIYTETEATPDTFITGRVELYATVSELFDQEPNAPVPLLFGGDRLTCCDEGIVMRLKQNLVGLASIAPYGEGLDVSSIAIRKTLIEQYGNSEEELGPEPELGEPTIVGLYVKRTYRQKGYGDVLLRTAIARDIDRGFQTIRIDSMNSRVMRMLEKLPQDVLSNLHVEDLGPLMDSYS